ncbi:MAG: DUF356 domain-containing protein [Euryarchaeota archaeon]|jgi:hypothetical protein|nr:DUF356 domain-containing protein [Euryarchaeota archaeon]HNS25287.1 DUF356 domain-containing protein [Methanobacteriaceae archaeon]
MSLIMVRADSRDKILNSLADIERHAKLKIKGNPRIIQSKMADETAKRIMNQNLKFKSSHSVLVLVESDTTQSIVQIRKIHPPAHLMVISEEYPEYAAMNSEFQNLPHFKGYYSHKKRHNIEKKM